MIATSQLKANITIAASEPFDSIAPVYDRVFTDSAIGRAQREQVTAQINRRFLQGSHVLELNCGTGEDAFALAQRGVEVTAYDASPAMIDIAQRRLQADSLASRASFDVLRNESLDLIDGSFDGALSNFAGMNCCSDWAQIAKELSRLIKPGGHVLLCIMGRACLWEIAYFLLRGQPRKAFRRASRNHTALVGGSSVVVHYLSVRQARQAFADGFTLCGWRGVGVFVPPSYCEALMTKRSKLLRVLAACDLRFGHVPGMRRFGDHVLLDFVRNTP
jgi:ubiquinone/menaquinone biosynthesis C-methylase UbiE